MMTNLEVAQSVALRPISEIALSNGLGADDFESWGKFKGKLTQEGVSRFLGLARKAKLVLVTAITPTSKGEGKTTVTIGLSQGLNRLGLRTISATREPALGPVFGVKGGACGGGRSQVLPMEDINLLFTGDFPAISAAHNLLSAVVDSHIHGGNALHIDASVDRWPRTVDMNDRALRSIVTGLGGKINGPTRESGFVITPASEVMAILCMSRDLAELRERLGRIVAAVDANNNPVTAKDLGVDGAMAALLRDAIRPNLAQTVEGDLAFVHGGPFGNIAHGCSSIVATECALGLADYAVTEAGFGSDLGAEKFLDLVCPVLGQGPDAIVLVATIRALRQQGENALEAGLANLMRHISHLLHYGPPIVVAINRFSQDTGSEVAWLVRACAEQGIEAIPCDPYGGGGEGCKRLAEAVTNAASGTSDFKSLYLPDDPFTRKLEKVVSLAYGGAGIEMSAAAKKDLEWLEKHGYGSLPVCVAKTQYSLSDNPKLLNAPTGFKVDVHSLRLSAGAGFVVAVCGDIMLMPGLGKTPAALSIDIDAEGRISGMF